MWKKRKEKKDIAFECREARVTDIDSRHSPTEDNGVIVCDFSFCFHDFNIWIDR